MVLVGVLVGGSGVRVGGRFVAVAVRGMDVCVQVGGSTVLVGAGLFVADRVLVRVGLGAMGETVVETVPVGVGLLVCDGLFVAVGELLVGAGVAVELIGRVGVTVAWAVMPFVAEAAAPPGRVAAGTGLFRLLNNVDRRSGKSVGDWPSARALLIRSKFMGGIASSMGSFA